VSSVQSSPLGLCEPITCFFGGVPSPGQVWTASQVACQSPATGVVGSVPISIQLPSSAGDSASDVMAFVGNFTYYAALSSGGDGGNDDWKLPVIISLSVGVPLLCFAITVAVVVVIVLVWRRKGSKMSLISATNYSRMDV